MSHRRSSPLLPVTMSSISTGRSPREELEDGEICDDDPDESVTSPPRRGDGGRLRGEAPPLARKPYQRPHNFRLSTPYNPGPQPFPPGHRQQCGPSGPDRPRPASVPPLPPPGLGPHGEPSPRSSFWERSHGALGRFRHRGMPNGGRGAWNRGGWSGSRAPPGRYGLEDGHCRTESPSRKPKLLGRTQGRKVSKAESSVDESFEDLLSKYKQIQLELEVIRKEESMALVPKEPPAHAPSPPTGIAGSQVAGEAASEMAEEGPEIKVFQAFNIKPLRQKLPTPARLDRSREEEEQEEEVGAGAEPEPEPGAAAAAAAAADETEACVCCVQDTEEDGKTTSQRDSRASSEDSVVLLVSPEQAAEEEDLSELQLRLLALQSASRKWQQKEQQVMKRSRERITRAVQDRSSAPSRQRVTTRSAAADRTRARTKPMDRERERAKPGTRDRAKVPPRSPLQRGHAAGRVYANRKTTSPAEKGSAVKQAARKQQPGDWKLQRHQEEKRRQEEEDERRKREEEIRRIRDLSNQDEQYNRFMKLVGGRTQLRSRSRDGEHRKSTGKGGMDASGNLYQYDNYDEVAMETDSETSSPAPSPTHTLFAALDPGCFPPTALYETVIAGTPVVPPPPPPLPPPPDELEPPPKPPFADEEEEEEMLLRETCLMSMANKRVTPGEDKLSTCAPPPSCAPPEPPARGNLSAVSLNTVPLSRTSKFSRGPHAPRAPLVLPRHKSVVVSLNDSDDSDSDASGSTPVAFGGLEFMIKEARRTAEAAKPKVASGSEKENNPLRTAAAANKAKEEVASRAQEKTPLPPHGSLPVAPVSDLSVSSAEHKLLRHRDLLLRDESVLRHLLLQETKKVESLRAAEAKVVKLREQLNASERIVSANKLLLRKLQEQVQRVEQRVSIKRSVAVRLEQELLQAQQAARRGSKRKVEGKPRLLSKLQRVDSGPPRSERHFAELIAQKQLLQRLESEYALKIQKLKEAQALRNKGVAAEPAPAAPPPRSQPPQPSLHDLTQDKLTLDSEDAPDADDHESESAAAATGTRRHSFRQSSSSTKPNLEQLGFTPSKDTGAKAAKASGSPLPPTEVFAGLDVDTLRRRYEQQVQLGELLLHELQNAGETVVVGAPAAQVVAAEVDAAPTGAELKPVPFAPYHSPLLVFRSYRFSPYYRTKEKLSLSSVTFSNAIDPKKCFCHFDLTGTCNDDECHWQHMRNCTLTGNQLFQDILSYGPSLIGCSESSADQDVSTATEKYVKKLFGSNNQMGVDQKAVLLVSKVNESRRHVPPFTTWKNVRRWRPKPSAQSGVQSEDSEDEAAGDKLVAGHAGEELRCNASAACTSFMSEDKRYFVSDTDDIWNLEASVLESPRDTQLWIKLAFRYLSQSDTPPAECLEAALNTLSRALENNCDDPEVWSHYLTLFSRRGSRDEVQEMCEMAVEHAPDHHVWWNFLCLESSFEGKDYVCQRLLHFLMGEASCGVTDKLSFQLMEALLYRVELNLFTGRVENALAILQNALKSAQDRSIAEYLRPSDRALVWLSYIHLREFERLPASLYELSQSGPSRLLSTDHFLLPWRTVQDISTPPDVLVALFQDGVRQCADESLSSAQGTLACLPLHLNLLLVHKLLDRVDEGVSLCQTLLATCPESCSLRDTLAELLLSSGRSEQAVGVWLQALADCPNNAEVFYRACRFLVAQDKSSAIAPLLRGFVLSLCEGEQSHRAPLDVLRHVLGFPTAELPLGPVIKRELDEQLKRQMSYLHLAHCCWQRLHGSEEETVDAFERALGACDHLDELHQLWTEYLVFSSQSASRSRCLSDLVYRCLSSVPSRLEVPFNPAQFWTCYRFHNKVASFYLSCLPPSQHADVLERLRYALPNNIHLCLRLMHQEMTDGNIEHVKFQARTLICSAPKCLSAWKIAIAVETELKDRSEVRRLHQQALENLPLCAALWKDRLQFEVAGGGGASERLRQLLARCQEVGVSLDEVRGHRSEQTVSQS